MDRMVGEMTKAPAPQNFVYQYKKLGLKGDIDPSYTSFESISESHFNEMIDKHLLKVKSITAQQRSDYLNLGSLELELSNGESFKHSQGELDPDRRYTMDLENFKIDEIQI